jgi:predicted nucleotidyltransferase
LLHVYKYRKILPLHHLNLLPRNPLQPIHRSINRFTHPLNLPGNHRFCLLVLFCGFFLFDLLFYILPLMQNQHLIDEMTERLKELKPYKVILFGSYARGTATEDSDLDVLIVLDSNDFAKTFDERMNRWNMIYPAVLETNRKIALDTITYSKAEYEHLLKEDDFFVKEIVDTGKVLYERKN